MSRGYSDHQSSAFWFGCASGASKGGGKEVTVDSVGEDGDSACGGE